jgi:hypothetical protein
MQWGDADCGNAPNDGRVGADKVETNDGERCGAGDRSQLRLHVQDGVCRADDGLDAEYVQVTQPPANTHGITGITIFTCVRSANIVQRR